MYIGIVRSGYNNEDWAQVQVIKVHPNDDQWKVGDVILTAINELVLL